MKDEVFWVKFVMESGRGHTVTYETYVYYKRKDGVTEKDTSIFEDDAYNWAGKTMGGFDLMRFTSKYELVPKPPTAWLKNRYKTLSSELKIILNTLGGENED